jgi:pyrroline-5-carboxylate reductase
MKHIGIIGCGNMGGAIVKQLSQHSNYALTIYDKNDEVSKKVATMYKIKSSSLEELLASSDIVLLAVKPQILPLLYPILHKAKTTLKWISIAAGVSLSTLEEKLDSTSVVRLMPNMAASVAKSVTALSHNSTCPSTFVQEAIEITQTFGTVHVIDESLISAFIGISGSGIATCFSFFHNMALGAVHSGLNYQTALSLICETSESAAALVKETHEHPESLVTKVCSPGGTTIEAMRALADGNFSSCVIDSVVSAAEKATYMEQLAKGNKEGNK